MFTKIIFVTLSMCLTIVYGSNSEHKSAYEKCRGPGDPGPCKSYLYKWRFEVTTHTCNTFIWGGCLGNTMNTFDSEADCIAACLDGNYTSTTNLSSTPSTNIVNSSKETTLVDTMIPSKNIENFMNLGDELVFRDSEHKIPEKEFMFAQNNTFIQIDGETIKTFQLRLCREISFQFRTRLPHGLLVYHNVKNPEGIELDPYALYVIVEKGQLKVVHVFGKHSTSVIVGEGLNRDEWHNVVIRIDVHGARLIARVDESTEEVYLKGLNHDTNYGVSTNLPSVVLVGGLSSEEKLHGVKYIIESFVGCIRDIVLKSGKAASDLLPITPLVASKHENVVEGCRNSCETSKNLCFVGSRCINHFSSLSCDCFGTNYEGELCDIYSSTVLTLRGSSYVSYRIYDWKDRTHSPVTRISIMFRTWFDDSILFYASGETIKPQYIAASLKNNTTYIEMDFGDGPFNCTLGNNDLAAYYWHNLTIYHDHKTVKIILDDQMRIFEGAKNLLFDPEIYFGGGPDLNKKRGLASNNNFAGSLKYVFYNDVSILYELKRGNPKVHYIGVLSPEFADIEVDVIPITYPFATSHIWWPIKNSNEMSLKFDFKSSRNTAILAYSEVQTKEGAGFWEIRLYNDKINFDLVTENNMTIPTSIKIDNPTAWHVVEVIYANETISFTVDYKHRVTQMYGLSFNVGNKIIIGSSLKASGAGLVGCMRDLSINGVAIEPRFVVKTERVVGEIALDNCQFVDPCRRPNTCEHNGKCIVKNDRVTCDCKNTGYEGKNCHFSKFRKTCEELALLGYTKSDVYLIDIDGNGVFPPVHVKCEFQTQENLQESTKTITIIEHNLQSQIDVRSTTLEDFSFDIKYREFTPEMLQELISHSLYCHQHIKYDCLKAPLDLNSATWFKSSYNKNSTIIDFIGNSKRGSCECAINKTCEDANESCNCDKFDNKWSSDEGTFNSPHSLGITHMYFLQQKNLDDESQGRITLGPLECVETNTQKYVVTFTTSQSYIEVPGWRKGDIAFSFRTTGEKAILLFQPPIRPNFPSFLVALTGDYQLTFAFTLNTGTTREIVINSRRKLNGGEWHKIWIDYNDYHVRFMINQDFKMVDLLPEEQFGPFEGSMFIGGATPEFVKKKEGLLVKQGLIGCFRGLVVNGEILDIYSYMSVHLSEIIKDCKPSCVPNPCKNGAQCKELWSEFQCICKNPWSHVGVHCETNYNEKALTFTNRGSYFKTFFLDENGTSDNLRAILKENLLVNIRTYDKQALILYAHDNFNNFVHLYLNNNEIVYLYNHGNEIQNLNVTSKNLSIGKSIQIAVVRSETSTTLHVNDNNATIEKGVLLLKEYSNKPWVNPELEVLSPHRPPAPTVSYFQLNLAGYDPSNLLRANNHTVDGLIGCVRGLKIGENLINLADIENEAHVKDGVLNDCQMYCDSEPCKNGGICTENFDKKEASSTLCDCEHTSFLGETCMEDKGAEFSGESGLRRKYQIAGKVDHLKLQMAFSTNDMRRANRIMMLVQSEEPRYYLMIGTTADHHLFFEEDRNGQVYSAIVKQDFTDNARHSVYYKRNLNEAILLIDRIEINITKQLSQNVTNSNLYESLNIVSIGGVNSTDPRFAVYKSYSGCLSNIILEVNKQSMKPLEEYMLFTKTDIQNIDVLNPTGVRSAQCNTQFESKQKQTLDGPLLNISIGIEKTWIVDTPPRKPYKSIYIDNNEQEEQTQLVFIVLISLFFIIIIACIIEVYRTDKQYKKRLERETDESIIWSKEQATRLATESPGSRKFSYKAVGFDDVKSSEPLVGILKNGNVPKQVNIETSSEKPEKRDSNASIRETQIPEQELNGSENSNKTNELQQSPEIIENENELLKINEDRLDLGKSYSKYVRARQLSFPPPTHNTQLPFKLEEDEEEDEDEDDEDKHDENQNENEENGENSDSISIDDDDVNDDDDDENESSNNEKNSSTSESFEVIK